MIIFLYRIIAIKHCSGRPLNDLKTKDDITYGLKFKRLESPKNGVLGFL